jgi:hypothetical protein
VIAKIVARIGPPGLAFGKPEDRLRETREKHCRMSLSLDTGYVIAR